MNILSALSRLHRAPAPRTRRRRGTVAAADPADRADRDLPAGCGWFDSSHELRCGLIVREHATPDTLAGELPLANWLERHLAGWPGPAPAPRPRW
jgi:hypothetical protein